MNGLSLRTLLVISIILFIANLVLVSYSLSSTQEHKITNTGFDKIEIQLVSSLKMLYI